MSSGFVSGGTTDAPIQRDDKWLAVQLEIERERKERKDREKASAEGKSLFETLEANKAAKQEAFEEANRLKNQFRALDDDEIEFLNEIRGRELAEEAKVRQETKEGVDTFRKHREEIEKIEREKESQHDVVEEVKEEEWKVGRKRKAGKEKVGGLGIKLRKTSTPGSKQESEEAEKAAQKESGSTTDAESPIESNTNGDAKADGPAAECKDMINESICVRIVREDAIPYVRPTAKCSTAKSTAALVSYDSDEDDDW